MISPFATSDVLSHGGLLALPFAFLAGLIAACNPCCVALYPAAAAMYCGTKPPDACCGASVPTTNRGLKSAIAFMLGIASATTVLRVIAAMAGTVIGQIGSSFRYPIAAVPLLMGLHLLGWLRLPIGHHSSTSSAKRFNGRVQWGISAVVSSNSMRNCGACFRSLVCSLIE